ncbi:hypothetical protein Psal006b_02807 [Piscirickettsia salmonis]|uniref:CBS domain protein n=1 Tax=Piscirickettsia salmonis TaxID=1238 RepID=A0AAC8VFU1_PISSA|nr:CBS domain protein [Piscirickettsia salmonis]QGN99783.1 hypothetical protein Psal006b_02807 [Piscirickettsia salmonis]QGO03434.1 hypothetical protein Psal008_02839 [Piscirickettsia salmonis]QGO14065.1 hypothetical protein Psal010b_02801 [Piscirickettsia salmonis]QGO21162.1 hypothetical protein Psal013_02844 [Piscirickettsia salmonis]
MNMNSLLSVALQMTEGVLKFCHSKISDNQETISLNAPDQFDILNAEIALIN